jgi:hypothetical protein
LARYRSCASPEMATYIEQAGVLAAIVSEAFGQHYDGSAS